MSTTHELLPVFLPEITINWHITEACSYGCDYCYAKWSTSASSFRHTWPKVIDALAQLPGQRLELQPRPVIAERVRLNFAGGEPFIEKSLGAAISAAHDAGLSPSFISNGSLITDEFIHSYGSMIAVAGFSFDSFDELTRDKIGRRMRSKRGLDQNRLAEIFDLFRAVSPSTMLKVNTVVCQENVSEDMRQGLEQLAPRRWKMLRVIPDHGGKPVDDVSFSAFVDRHSNVKGAVVETNEDMARSYLMLNPDRKPFQRLGKNYKYGDDILNGALEAFRSTEFDAEAYRKRYLAKVKLARLFTFRDRRVISFTFT